MSEPAPAVHKSGTFRTREAGPRAIVCALGTPGPARDRWMRAWNRLADTTTGYLPPDLALASHAYDDSESAHLVGAGSGTRLWAALPVEDVGRGVLQGIRTPATKLQLIGDRRCAPYLWAGLRELGDWHLLVLSGVEHGPLSRALLARAAQDGARTSMRPWGRTYYLPLDRFEQRLDQVWIRHLHASAEALPDLHYRELKKPARFAVEAFFAMEKNPDGEPVAGTDEEKAPLLAQIRALAKRDQLRMGLLFHGATPLAAHIAATNGHTYQILAAGEHKLVAGRGAEDLLVLCAARHARERGMKELSLPADIGGRDLGWCSYHRDLSTIRIYRGFRGWMRTKSRAA